MEERYEERYSEQLSRNMGHAVFGYAGKLCLAFGPQNGHLWDFRNFGMVSIMQPWIDAGKIRLICVDSIDEESWSDEGGDGRHRAEMQEKWFWYVIEELLPEHLDIEHGEKAMVTGCSMGGLHSANFFFRRPDLFDTMISLSGVFDATYFFGSYMDDIVYNNSPLNFLPNMPDDHPWLDMYRQSNIIFCCGQGAWEDKMREDSTALDRILTEKNVPHWADFWGYDVNHDWPWWQKQLPYFLEHIMGSA